MSSKRKAAHSADEPPAQRGAHAAPAPAAAAAAAHQDEEEDASLYRAQLSVRRAAHSLKLAELLSSPIDVDAKLAAVAACLLEDAARPDSLIQLSLQYEWHGTLLMMLVDVLAKTNEEAADSAAVKEQKKAALRHMNGGVWRHLETLMQSYDVAARRGGRTALHVVVSAGVPEDERDWPYRLARMLLRCGSDVDAVESRGCKLPALLMWSRHDYDDDACGLQLLLQHGANPNVQNSFGSSLLHLLVHHVSERPLRRLTESGLLASVDLFATDCDDLTPLELAESLERQHRADVARASIRRILEAQEQMWRSEVRPFMTARVEAHVIPQLAAMVMAYVDGD